MRYVFIGDIHGCFDEIHRLLEKIEVDKNDIVVSLGDMVSKGPDVLRCVELWHERRYKAIAGNKELQFLHRRRMPVGSLLVDRADRRLARDRALVGYLESWPRFLDFESIGVLAVHGGVVPGTSTEPDNLMQRGDEVVTLRKVRPAAHGWIAVPKADEKSGDVFWADVWDGPRRVVYGHTPRRDVKRTKNTIGLDTGCVYGGKLSAAIFESKDKFEVVSVAAKRAYARR